MKRIFPISLTLTGLLTASVVTFIALALIGVKQAVAHTYHSHKPVKPVTMTAEQMSELVNQSTRPNFNEQDLAPVMATLETLAEADRITHQERLVYARLLQHQHKFSDALAELDHALVLGLEFLLALFGLVLLGVAGESLGLSAGNPTLVEAAAGLLAKVLGPDGVEGAEALGGLDVADNANDVHGGSLDDGHSLDNLLLVELGTELVDGTGDVGHTGLVTHESSEVGLLGGIIDREGTDVATVVLGALARQETKVSVAGSLELTVGHL